MRNKVIAAVAALVTVTAVVLLARFVRSDGSAERGLQLYLPLHEDLEDHSVFKRKVTVTGGVTLAGGHARFPGNGSWLSVPHIALDRRPFAISVWVKWSGTAQTCGLLDEKDEDSDNHHLYLLLARERPYFGFFNNDARAKKYLVKDVWNHIVFRYTGYDQQIWINGVPAVDSHAAAFAGAKGDLRIGAQPGLNDFQGASDYVGLMRELRVYEGEMTPTKIKALYWRSFEGLD
jgi:hypothetical protein